MTREAPVGIEPTNRGFAVVQALLLYALPCSVPLRLITFELRLAALRSIALLRTVPRIAPQVRSSQVPPSVEKWDPLRRCPQGSRGDEELSKRQQAFFWTTRR